MLILTACHPYLGYMQYELEYSTGYSLNLESYRQAKGNYSIENSKLEFQVKPLSEEKKTIVTLVEESGEELWTWVKPLPLPYLRAQVVDGELWFCEERWNTGLGYLLLDGLLESGILYQLDIDTGEILWKREIEKNEFYLTKIGERFYFYQRGGKREYAQIYYRNLSDWEEKHELYQFDYKEAPKDSGGEHTLRFVIEEETITVEYLNIEEILWTEEILLNPE